MRFHSAALAVSITAHVLGYPTSLEKRVTISSVGDVAGSEVISGGKNVAGTGSDALTTAQTDGIAAVAGTGKEKGSTGIQTISSEDIEASLGGGNGIRVIGQKGEDKKNIGSQGPAQAVAAAQALGDQINAASNQGKIPVPGSSSNQPSSSSTTGKKPVGAAESQSQSIQEVSIGGAKGVLVGGGQDAKALGNTFGALTTDTSKGKVEAKKNEKDSDEEAEAKAEASDGDEGDEKTSKAGAKDKETATKAEDANVGLVIDGKEIPIDPSKISGLSVIDEEAKSAGEKSDKKSAGVQSKQKSSNLEADDEKASASEEKEKESKSSGISTGSKFGFTINGKEYSIGGSTGLSFNKSEKET